ncbi:MAG: hypothetical protein WCW40_12080, partial [Bacteroidota bacterium]
DTKHYFATGELTPKRTLAERIDKCIELLTLSVERKGEKRAVIEMRKFYIGYLKGEANAAKLRNHLMQYYESSPIIEILHSVKEKGHIEEERFLPAHVAA